MVMIKKTIKLQLFHSFLLLLYVFFLHFPSYPFHNLVHVLLFQSAACSSGRNNNYKLLLLRDQLLRAVLCSDEGCAVNKYPG
jgi:hypothetical protein